MLTPEKTPTQGDLTAETQPISSHGTPAQRAPVLRDGTRTSSHFTIDTQGHDG
jgi:hypothetical protein